MCRGTFCVVNECYMIVCADKIVFALLSTHIRLRCNRLGCGNYCVAPKMARLAAVVIVTGRITVTSVIAVTPVIAVTSVVVIASVIAVARVVAVITVCA